jgi:Zn-dependent oligopeptidase
MCGADMDDLKAFAKEQGAAEGDSMKHWDIMFWSERLREAKFSISEVFSILQYHSETSLYLLLQ